MKPVKFWLEALVTFTLPGAAHSLYFNFYLIIMAFQRAENSLQRKYWVRRKYWVQRKCWVQVAPSLLNPKKPQRWSWNLSPLLLTTSVYVLLTRIISGEFDFAEFCSPNQVPLKGSTFAINKVIQGKCAPIPGDNDWKGVPNALWKGRHRWQGRPSLPRFRPSFVCVNAGLPDWKQRQIGWQKKK